MYSMLLSAVLRSPFRCPVSGVRCCVTMWCWICFRAFRLLFPGCTQTSLRLKSQKSILNCPFSCLAVDHVLQALCRFDSCHRPPGQRAADLPAVKHLVVADGRRGALAVPFSHSSFTLMPYFSNAGPPRVGVYRPFHHAVHCHVSARFYHFQTFKILAFAEFGPNLGCRTQTSPSLQLLPRLLPSVCTVPFLTSCSGH